MLLVLGAPIIASQFIINYHFFGHNLGFKLVFVLRPEIVGPFTTLETYREYIVNQQRNIPASWSSGNAFVSIAEGLRFKSQAGQSNTVLLTARHRRNFSSKGAMLLAGPMTR